MIWKFFLTILILLFVGLNSLSLYFYFNPAILENQVVTTNIKYQSNNSAEDLEFQKISLVEKSPKNVNDVYITGWIPDWDIPDGLNALAIRPNVFDSISPVWFFINPDGTLKRVAQANGPTQLRYFRENNIKLIPAIQEFDAENFSKAINGEGQLDKLVQEIVSESVKYNYDGIDLDIEATKLQDKQLLIEFVRKLSEEFKALNKTLVYTALPKWSDYNLFASFPQTMRTQEYGQIAQYVDEFRVMTYEFSSPRGDLIGPVQPLVWQEQVLKYAIYSGVPRDKLVLGVATYSYDWSEREFMSEINFRDRTVNQNGEFEDDPAVSLSNKDVDKIKANYEYTESFNEEWGEMILKYNFRGQNRVVVYPSDRSMDVRKELAAQYGIKGVAYWRIGDDGNLKL